MRPILSILLFAPLVAQAASTLPLELAHKKGFKGCDAAISKVFTYMDGDVRVNVSTFDQTAKDSLKLTATGGTPGDSVYIEAEFRKQGSACVVTQTSMLTMNKSCDNYVGQDVPAFRFVARSADFAWYQNQGGVNLMTRDVGGACVAVFQLGLIE